jgi:glycerol-3-phosphate dehydrogenase (NAD(P)+)
VGQPYDERVLAALRSEGKHPLLREHLPAGVEVLGPEDLVRAVEGCEIAVMGANSHGARSLAGMVRDALGSPRHVVSVAKGLEPQTHARISAVYGEVLERTDVVAIGGPCLAAELADGDPTAAVWASAALGAARSAGSPFESAAYQVTYTDDVAGVEYCSMVKNVAAIGLGFLDGIGKPTGEDFKNAKAALFTKARTKLAELVESCGRRTGRPSASPASAMRS